MVTFRPEIFRDGRGEFTELYHEENYVRLGALPRGVRFVEDDVSISRKGALKGLHGDRETWKLICCLRGEIQLAIVDFRSDSETYRASEIYVLDDRERRQVLIPPGCANGHLCLSESAAIFYKQSEYYRGGEHQFTLRWNDPALGIPWRIDHPLLSERDANAPYIDQSR